MYVVSYYSRAKLLCCVVFPFRTPGSERGFGGSLSVRRASRPVDATVGVVVVIISSSIISRRLLE